MTKTPGPRRSCARRSDDGGDRQAKVQLMAFSPLAKMSGSALRAAWGVACGAALAASLLMTGETARAGDAPADNGRPHRSRIEISGPVTRPANSASSLGAMRLEAPQGVPSGLGRPGVLAAGGGAAMSALPNDRGLASASSTLASPASVSGPATAAYPGAMSMARSVPTGGAPQSEAIPVAPQSGIALAGKTEAAPQPMNASAPLPK
jgi:hypothetical protein